MKKYCVTHNSGLKYLFWGTLFLLLALRAGLWAIESAYADNVDMITNFPSSSQVYDRNGLLLYEYFDLIRRIPVEQEEIPYYLVSATIMAEDERFFLHSGFDPLGIVRAFWKNIRAGRIEEGGSTLGQQLVKNTVLGPSEGYVDKLQEILFSIAIDAKYSKNDIVYLYLNTIPYGSNVYGVEAASRHYFNKHVNDITLSEAAVLAALPKQPTYLSPYGANLDKLLARRDHILNKMFSAEYITEGQLDSALSDEVVFHDPEIKIKAPHFVMYVREQLENAYGRETVFEGGLLITTTLDYEMQKKAEEIVDENADIFDYYQADSVGLIALDSRNGDILTMVGNRDYFDAESAGNFNMTIAKRQPGSAFKPLVYSALLEESGFSPASTLYDVRKNFALPGQEPYIPKNYDNRYRGAVTVRDALGQSLNVPAVQALLVVGVEEALDFVENLGISTVEDRSRFGPSLVLGGAEVTLLDLSKAYSVFSNQGKLNDAQSILKIAAINEDVYHWERNAASQVIYPETAYQITSILSDNKARSPVFGWRNSLAFAGQQVAAKTGTTQEYRDAWTIGYTSDIVVGVWAGNHDNKPLRYGAAGVFVASPIWRGFMDYYLEAHPAQDFEMPEGLHKKTIYTIAGRRTEYIADWQLGSLPHYVAPKPVKLLAVTEVFPNQAVNAAP